MTAEFLRRSRSFNSEVGGQTRYGDYNLASYAPNPISWIDPWGLQHKNSNAAKGEFILYRILEDRSPDAKILKIGKAKAEDVMAGGANRRAYTSERIAQKKGYPDAVHKLYKELGYTTTGKAKKVEAKAVRTLRNQGHELPLNKEKGRSYQANSRRRGIGKC